MELRFLYAPQDRRGTGFGQCGKQSGPLLDAACFPVLVAGLVSWHGKDFVGYTHKDHRFHLRQSPLQLIAHLFRD